MINQTQATPDSSAFSRQTMVPEGSERHGYRRTLFQVPPGGTDRAGQEGRPTLRIFEIFELRLNSGEQKQVIQQIQADPQKHILLLKPEIIRLAKSGKVDLVLERGMGLIPEGFIGKKISLADNCPAVLEDCASADISHLAQAGELRLSPAGLYRIEVEVDGEKLCLLSFNKNRLKKGKLMLSPVGGAYDFAGAEGKAEYEKAGIRMSPEDAAKPLEMRQSIPGRDLPEFLHLFRSGRGRETDPVRELKEELVGARSEESVFDSLPEDAVPAQSLRFEFDRWQEVRGYRAAGLSDSARSFLADEHRSDRSLVLEWGMTRELLNEMGCGQNPAMRALLGEAVKIAAEKHAELDNFVRDDLRAYIVHPIETALAAVRLGERSPAIVLAALFHDLPEDAKVEVRELREEIERAIGQTDEVMSHGDWRLTERIVDRLTEDVGYREDPSLSYRSNGCELRGRLATKIEHLDRVSQNLDRLAPNAFRRALEGLSPEDREVLSGSVLLKTLDRVQNLMTNGSAWNKRERLMEPVEIVRWRSFLGIPLIPSNLRQTALDLLAKEEGRLQ